jgi:hypothetical protein
MVMLTALAVLMIVVVGPMVQQSYLLLWQLLPQQQMVMEL